MLEGKMTHESLGPILKWCLDYFMCTPKSKKWEVYLGTDLVRQMSKNG